MDIKDVLALAKAGFNATQIAQMSTAPAVAPPVVTPPVVTPPVEAPPVAAPPVVAPPVVAPPVVAPPVVAPPVVAPPVVAPPVVAPPVVTPNPMDAIMTQIANLTNTVQANALNNTQLPTPENAEDILAAIINPPIKETK